MRPDPALTAVVSIVPRVVSYRGRIHCPGCGAGIGRAESPAIGYVKECPHCNAPLEIRLEGNDVVITLRRGHA